MPYSGKMVGLLLLASLLGTESFCLMITPGRAAGSAKIVKKTISLEKIGGGTASISFPMVSMPGDQDVLTHVQKAVDLKAGTGMSFEEWEEDVKESWWLEEITYKVNYNKNSILSLTYSVSGSGAYPSTNSTHLVVDLKTGRPLHAEDIIKTSSLEALASALNRRLRSEVEKTIRQNTPELEFFTEELDKARFTVKDLTDFLIEEKGITFFFDFGFPHVAQALEPEEEYFLIYADLRLYLKADGPLGPVAARK